MLDYDKGSYEGRQENIRKLKTPKIDTWESKYPDKNFEIEFIINEFTCVCPKTGMPDFAVLHIRYSPAKKCLELKSLKMYMNFYREVGIFHEHAINKILDDLASACKPKWMKIEGEFNIRGGIKTTVKAEYLSKKNR